MLERLKMFKYDIFMEVFIQRNYESGIIQIRKYLPEMYLTFDSEWTIVDNLKITEYVLHEFDIMSIYCKSEKASYEFKIDAKWYNIQIDAYVVIQWSSMASDC